MPSSNRSRSRSRIFHLLVIGALVVISRAPFLARADRFFDADEAVEGLMARHVLQGEHPSFLWGQRYKGVPEVYLTAATFAVTGPSVVALKSVTLGCFVAFVLLQFVLVERLFSRGVAWMASAFLIAGPPSLVLWSVSGSAEIVWTLLAGTVVCLGVDVWRRTRSRTALALACAAAGFGLWVQQFIVYYLAALALAMLYDLPRRRALVARFLSTDDLPGWARAVWVTLGGLGVVYIALGIAAFLTGGFDLSVARLHAGIHHPQKMWNIGAALLAMCAVARGAGLLWRHGPSTAKRTALVGVAAFVAGYAPALAGRFAGRGGAPVPRMDAAGLRSAVPAIGHQLLPIVAGVRSPSTTPLDVPAWLGWIAAGAVVASFVAVKRRPVTPFFHILFIVAPLLFLMSGAFVDAQSYRYLMPVAGACSVVLALGVWELFQRSRVAGIASLSLVLLLFVLEQRAWYQQLVPDTRTTALIDCLDRNQIRAAYADYWTSYKVTFLTGERIVVVPNDGVDRYAPYRQLVSGHPEAPTIADTIPGSCVESSSSAR